MMYGESSATKTLLLTKTKSGADGLIVIGASLREIMIFTSMAMSLVLNYGFMLLRLPPGAEGGVPIGIIILIICIVSLIGRGFDAPILFRCSATYPFVMWFSISGAGVLSGYFEYGLWALRDGTHTIDSLYFVVGFCVAASPQFINRLDAFFKYTTKASVLYFATYPFRESLAIMSPKLTAAAGFDTSLLGNYATTGIVNLLYVIRQLLLGMNSITVMRLVLAAVVLALTAALLQQRTIYIQIIAVMGLLTIFNPRAASALCISFLLGLGVVATLLTAGLEFKGRLGETVGLEFLVAHIGAIWGEGGAGSVQSAAEGVGLRLTWWQEIWSKMSDSPSSMLFGLGYGMPLTNFEPLADVIVREPHNSFMSAFGRTGLIGALCLVVFQAALVWHLVMYVIEARRHRSFITARVMLLILTFVLMVLLYSLVEDGLEKPYLAEPYYFLIGCAIRYGQQCVRNMPKMNQAQ